MNKEIQIINKYIKAVYKIENFYIKYIRPLNKLCKIYIDDLDPTFRYNMLNKKLLIRCYILHYGEENLNNLPEFFYEWMHKGFSQKDKLIMLNYIKKLPRESCRSPRMIKEFLELDCITREHIIQSGW